LAGVVGINPDPLTLRRLSAMAHGRQRCLWEHTAVLQAQMINLLRESPVSPNELNPYVQTRVRKGHPMDRETISHVRSMLRKRNAGRG
jgi:hypothetical protein